MYRKVTIAMISALALVVGTIGAWSGVAAAATFTLVLPQSSAFSILGHSCGGIQEKSYGTGFDSSSGYPSGAVYMSTSCGGSGRGGGYNTTTYTAWANVVWDFTSAVVSATPASTAPTVDPAFSAYDSNGNELYNSSNYAYLLLSPPFVAAPRVTAISVSAGPSAGGTTVAITGTGFTNATGVAFGSAAGSSITVSSDTSMTAVTPATTPGIASVTVTGPGGTSPALAAAQFTFVAAPTVAGLSPNSGPMTGGTTVTITGTGFTDASSVQFGGNPVGFSVIDDSTIQATSVAVDTADTAAVRVTTVGGTSAQCSSCQFTYVSASAAGAPVVSKVAPNYGPTSGGTAVTITGKNFVGTTSVQFGTANAGFFTVSTTGTSITATSPSGTGIVDVTATNASGTSTTTSADTFHYGPVVTRLSPTTGSAGGNTKVAISGHNLLGATGVDFGGEAARSFVVNSTGTSIAAVSPPEVGGGIQSVDVTVTGPGGTSPVTAATVFTYAPPAISKISPVSGSAGGNSKVTISGSRFAGTTALSFGGIPAASFTVNASGTSITARTPSEAGTGVQSVDVSATTAAGTGTLAAAFTYAAPVVTSISPMSGTPAGGTTVVITGTYLYGATAVHFGASSATITKMSTTSLTVVSPPGTGAVDVTVTDSAGTSALVAGDVFTY